MNSEHTTALVTCAYLWYNSIAAVTELKYEEEFQLPLHAFVLHLGGQFSAQALPLHVLRAFFTMTLFGES